jgi:hypothetical protein
MLNSIEDAFKYRLQAEDGAEYTFYRKSGGAYYDFTYDNRQMNRQRYSGDLSELFSIIRHFKKIGDNPYYVPFSGNPVVDKIKEMEKRFTSKPSPQPVTTRFDVIYV